MTMQHYQWIGAGLRGLMLANVLIVTACAPGSQTPVTVADTGATATGDLRVPTNYRETYQYLGTWAVAAESAAGSKEMHIVYASPGAAAGHRATGKFPDGATLVKEVFEATYGYEMDVIEYGKPFKKTYDYAKKVAMEFAAINSIEV